jgi:hypothetical protein
MNIPSTKPKTIMKVIRSIFQISIVTCLTACVVEPRIYLEKPEQKEGRTLILGEEHIQIDELVEFVSWKCRDYFEKGGILVEVGHASLPGDYDNAGIIFGFVLYDGTDTGEIASYERKGINNRWDWGPNGYDYAFTIKPDGKGHFYDFTSAPKGEEVQSDAVYKCHRP